MYSIPDLVQVLYFSPGPMGGRGQEGHDESEAKAGTLMFLQEL